MQTQTQALLKFLRDGKISRDIALQYANKPDEVSKAVVR
jgi:twitching motility protein PilT